MTNENENPPTTLELETVLAACLDDVEAGRDTMDGCLARYPALAAELAPALRAAAAVRALPPVLPDPAFRAVAGVRMQRLIQAQQAAAAPPPSLAPAPRRQPMWRSLPWPRRIACRTSRSTA